MSLQSKGRKHLKIYKFENLLSTEEVILKRIHTIETLSDKHKYIPEIRFKFEKGILEYRQTKLKVESSHNLAEETRINLLLSLSETLDKMHNADFVHGDINSKNIIYSGGELYIVDFEPDLYQIKHGFEQTLCTIPYISCNDLRNNEVSKETDKIGWYFFIARFLQDKRISKALQWMRLRKSNNSNNTDNYDHVITDHSFKSIVANFQCISSIAEKQMQISWMDPKILRAHRTLRD